MRRKIASLVAAVALAITFSVSSPAPAAALMCSGNPYITLWSGASGTEGAYTYCWSVSGIPDLSQISNGVQDCRGAFGFDNGTWTDCFTSANLTGVSATKAICVYTGTLYSGHYVKFKNAMNGHYGFSGLQWPYIASEAGTSVDDAISSIKSCTP